MSVYICKLPLEKTSETVTVVASRKGTVVFKGQEWKRDIPLFTC